MSEKLTNCSRCGTNPWKQGCYALWGKSPKDLLFDKENDTGYICSVCSVIASKRGRNLRDYMQGKDTGSGNVFAEKYKQCPVYGSKETGRFKDGVAFAIPLADQIRGMPKGMDLKPSINPILLKKEDEDNDPNLAEKIVKASIKDMTGKTIKEQTEDIRKEIMLLREKLPLSERQDLMLNFVERLAKTVYLLDDKLDRLSQYDADQGSGRIINELVKKVSELSLKINKK